MSRVRDGAFGVLLFLAALGPRLYVALAWAGEPVWDGHYYDFGARRIAAGLGYSDDLMLDGQALWHPWCHYPVGYSAFLAFFFRVFGTGARVAAVVNACTGSALAVMTWLLAREALPPWRARLAGLLVAVHPGMILYSALVMTEPLSALLTLAAFWFASRNARAPRGLILGGLTLGLAALVRPQTLLCAPFLAMAMPPREGPSARRAPRVVAGAIVACLLALVPVLPWTARNCRVMDGCALISTNGGWNLAIGAFPRATGRFETLRSSDGCSDVTGQVQQDRCWFSYGLRQINEHRRHWLALIPAKLGFTFDHESFAVEYLREARPAAWPEARRVRARGIVTTFHRALLCVAAVAFVAIGRRGRRAQHGVPARGWLPALAQGGLFLGIAALGYALNARGTPTFWPLVLVAALVPWLPLPGRPHLPIALRLPIVLLASVILTHAVFFGEDRYHVVVTPVLCLLAAAAFRRPAAGEGAEAQNTSGAPV